MKLVNFDTFAALPAGTVFSYFEPQVCSGLFRKGNTIYGDMDNRDPIDFFQSSFVPECINGADPTVDGVQSRWGLFEYEQQFAVLDTQDIETLMGMLDGKQRIFELKSDRLHFENLLNDRNAEIHELRSLLREAGFPDRESLGFDEHGNEEFRNIPVRQQLKDALAALAEQRKYWTAAQSFHVKLQADLRQETEAKLAKAVEVLRLVHDQVKPQFRFDDPHMSWASLTEKNLDRLVTDFFEGRVPKHPNIQ